MTVSVRGIGDVVIEPSHITCDASCTTTVVHGAAVTITANAADGFVLASWHGACAGTDGDTCVIHPNSDASITVVFAAAAGHDHGLESDAEHDCRHNSATADPAPPPIGTLPSNAAHLVSNACVGCRLRS